VLSKIPFMTQSHAQFIRYIVVGLVSNGIGYLLYLLLTTLGMGSKLTVSLLYIVGVLQTYVLNKKWTFTHHQKSDSVFFRYLIIYGLGYVINLGALFIFVDRLGNPHQLVQIAMMPIVAIFIFTIQKLWVFRVREQSGVITNVD
jgi:putative flippase GtrA